MSTLAEAIDAAFSMVSSCPNYREKYISARDWTAIICQEYSVPFEAVGAIIVERLNDEESYIKNEMHLKKVTAGNVATRFLYISSQPPYENAPYHVPERNTTTKHCEVTPEIRFQFLSALIPEVERRRGLKRPANNNSDNKDNKKNRSIPPMGFPQVLPPSGMPPPGTIHQHVSPPPNKAAPPVKKFALSDRTMSKRAAQLQDLVQQTADPATQVEIVRKLLNRRGMEHVKETLGNQFSSPIEGAVCSGVKEFLEHHHQRGNRPKHEQDAVDAVTTAVCFSDASNGNISKMANRLGVNTTRILNVSSRRAIQMKESGDKFRPQERKKRKDCYREEANKCISDYLHSDAVTHVDTRSKARVYKIKNPHTKQVESHPARIWNASGSKSSRYQAFIESQAYSDFNKDAKTISLEVFRQGLCGCIREPRQEEKSVATEAKGWDNGDDREYY